MADILRAPGSKLTFYWREGHPFFTYTDREQQPEFGNSAAILSCPLFRQTAAGLNYYYPNINFTPLNWIGNAGETRDIDRIPMKFCATYQGDTIGTDYYTWGRGIVTWSKANTTPAPVKLVFDNDNFAIDTIQGHNHAEIIYQHGTVEMCPPSLQMLQLRNSKTNKIATKFDHLSDVQLNLAGGDINYEPTLGAFDYAPATWKVEIAPLGSDIFTEIKITEIPELFHMPIYGAFYRADFADSNLKSESGWFKARISLTDAAGNSSVQTVEPLFYAKDATSGVTGIAADGFNLLTDGNTLRLSNGNNANFTVYAANGSCVINANTSAIDLSELPRGIYIAKAVAEGHTVTSKFAVR